MVEIAGQIIERKSSAFESGGFRDRYAVALKKLVDEKTKGVRITTSHQRLKVSPGILASPRAPFRPPRGSAGLLVDL